MNKNGDAGANRIIAHLDMDAFFAAVEERDNPRLRGRPLVVGADPEEGQGRGVVATANYAARAYGIRSALPISRAWRLAEEARKRGEPAVVFVGGNYRKYAEVSRRIFDVIRRRAPVTEEASVDEIYFDLSFCGNCEKAEEWCRRIKKEIFENEKLTCSVGIGPNKLVAKVASDRQKPDGLTVVREEGVEKFLSSLSVRVIPGVGPKTEEVLRKRGVKTVEDARKFSREALVTMFGKWGSELWEKIRGRDRSPVTEEYETKSIGEQMTFHDDTRDWGLVAEEMRALCGEVFDRFARSGFASFKTAVVTVRFADFTTATRARTLPAASSDRSVLQFEALKVLMPFFDARENPQHKAIRLIGVRVEKLGQAKEQGGKCRADRTYLLSSPEQPAGGTTSR